MQRRKQWRKQKAPKPERGDSPSAPKESPGSDRNRANPFFPARAPVGLPSPGPGVHSEEQHPSVPGAARCPALQRGSAPTPMRPPPLDSWRAPAQGPPDPPAPQKQHACWAQRCLRGPSGPLPAPLLLTPRGWPRTPQIGGLPAVSWPSSQLPPSLTGVGPPAPLAVTAHGVLEARTPSLLQRGFPTQGSDPGLLHCRQMPHQLSPQGSPSAPRSSP